MTNSDDSSSPDRSTSRQESAGTQLGKTFLNRLASGDNQAMSELFDRYSTDLAQVASQNIHPALIKRFDGEDVVQSVFRTFFRRHESGGLSIAHSGELWKLLVTITLCKTRSAARRHTADKRDYQSEQPQNPLDLIDQREVAPEDGLMFWEEVEILLKGLPDRVGQILTARLEGKSKTEIANELNISRQTVHRILNLMQDRLTHRMATVWVDPPDE